MIIRDAKNSLAMLAESLKNKIPISKVPVAPIPVHIAYAVPIGMLFCACHKNNPLNPIDITAKTIQRNLWPVVCDNLNPRGHPISNIPAITR